MPSPRFERVQELFRQRAEIEAEIEKLIMGDDGDEDESPPRLRHTGREKPIGRITKMEVKDGVLIAEGVLNRKPCGCALRGRSKASCRVCNPTIEDFVDDDAEGEETPQDKVCACGGVKRHKRDCENRDQPTVIYADEQLGPLKKYKCISCDTVVESRQNRLDLTCRPPCMSKTMVEIFDDDDV